MVVILCAVELCFLSVPDFFLDFWLCSFLDFRVRVFHNCFQHRLITGLCARALRERSNKPNCLKSSCRFYQDAEGIVDD